MWLSASKENITMNEAYNFFRWGPRTGMTTPLICQGLSWFYHWKPHVLENHLVLGKKWNVWRLSPDYLFLQPISWNMDEVVNHLGQGYGRRSLDPCQLHAAQLPYQLPTFMWKLNQLCSLVKATSTFFPANLTHQASSLASFLAMMIFVLFWNLATPTLTVHLIFNHRLLCSHLSYYMFKFFVLERGSVAERIWFRD